MATILPTLSTSGWLKTPKQIMSKMLVDCLLANYSQSSIFRGNITSIPYLAATYQKNPDLMVAETDIALKKYFERVFSVVTIEVTHELKNDNVSTYDLYVTVSIVEKGQSHSLATVASVDNGVISLLKTLNE